MAYKITVKINTYLKGKTKSGRSAWYKSEEERIEELSEEHYRNQTCEETVKWFRKIGGKEYVTYGYTSMGCVPIRVTSVRPDKQKKIVREYNIKYVD